MKSLKNIKTVTFAVIATLSVAVVLPITSHAEAAQTSSTQLQNSAVTTLAHKLHHQKHSKTSLGSVPTLGPVSGGSTTGTSSGTSTNPYALSSANLAIAHQIIAFGEKFEGTPYQYGAPAGQTHTFDCSSFVQYVFGQNGYTLPRDSREQSQVGESIPRADLQPGDLLFFSLPGANGVIGHVAIYIGNNEVLHTWGPGGVRIDSFSTPWISQSFVSAKRIIGVLPRH